MLTTDALVVFHHPAAGLSVGESGKLQGPPSPLQSLPALSGADSASPQTHCVKIAPRLAALIHILQRDGNLGHNPKVKSGRQNKYGLLK